MTIEETREWHIITERVRTIVNALEECYTCHRVSECEYEPEFGMFLCNACYQVLGSI